ncbi:unnamed protein product [Nippostrongylus brasiliensis]|uniref:Ras-related and estrogen-regulated growth inhibitor n=1 Tax=Nippostrongylus brasiliensis TaxID=27835 RepID=A0A0N4XCR3_NIPBR|nr:unnamed protein product [Nippostrongylus brasiliensis]
MSIEEEYRNEFSVVLLGSSQKSVLFEKLCKAAAKYERHVNYEDVHYLTVDCDGKEELVEITDPGLARTGGREVAIKRADLAMLFYSALSLNSLHNLQALKEDLETRRNLPLRLLCDSDGSVDDGEDGSSTGISSVSEGYESDIEGEPRIRRRSSMENIRKAQEDEGIAIEQGKKWASELGPCCEFTVISSSQFTDAKSFLEEIVSTMRSNRKKQTRMFIKRLQLPAIDGDSAVVQQENLTMKAMWLWT